MHYLLLILILFLLSCTNQYSVRDHVPYWYKRYKSGLFKPKFESDNYVTDSEYERYSRLYLDLVISKFKFIDNDSEFIFLKYRYIDHDWIFINQHEGIQIFLANGEIIKLSLDEPPSTKVENMNRGVKSGVQVYIHEYGIISIDKKSLKEILAHGIQTIRIKGRDDYIDYTDRLDILWNNWKEFSNHHLVEFLK